MFPQVLANVCPGLLSYLWSVWWRMVRRDCLIVLVFTTDQFQNLKTSCLWSVPSQQVLPGPRWTVVQSSAAIQPMKERSMQVKLAALAWPGGPAWAPKVVASALTVSRLSIQIEVEAAFLLESSLCPQGENKTPQVPSSPWDYSPTSPLAREGWQKRSTLLP